MKIETYIQKFNPCGDSQKYLRQFDTFEEAWAACERGDWMLSAARLLGVDLRVLALAKGLCANTVRHLMKDSRIIAAVDAAIAYGRGEIGRENLDDDDDDDAAAAAATYAAYAAADYAAYAAAAAAYAAVSSDYAAAYAAAYADDARIKNRQQTADICRDILTEEVLSAAERGE